MRKLLSLFFICVLLSSCITKRQTISKNVITTTLWVENNTAQHIRVYLHPSKEYVGTIVGSLDCLILENYFSTASAFVFELDGRYYKTPDVSLQGQGWTITINEVPTNWDHDMNSLIPFNKCRR